MVLQRRFFPNAIAFAAGFLSASLLVVVLLRAGASPLRGSFHGQVSTPPYLEGILEWTGSSSSLTLLEGHPGVSTLERGKEFQWVQTWRVVSTDQLRERAKQQGCDMAHSAVLASFWTDYKNYYHWMQDNALPAFVQYPDAHALRFFAEVDFPKPAGHHMTRHWIPRGVEGLPLRDKDPAMPHCVAIQNMHLMTAKYGLNFSKPGSRLRADSHINNMSGFAQRVAGEQFPLATTPRELRGHEREPVVVRVIQRRAEGRQRNFVELERVLEDTRQRLANREANGGPVLSLSLSRCCCCCCVVGGS